MNWFLIKGFILNKNKKNKEILAHIQMKNYGIRILIKLDNKDRKELRKYLRNEGRVLILNIGRKIIKVLIIKINNDIKTNEIKEIIMKKICKGIKIRVMIKIINKDRNKEVNKQIEINNKWIDIKIGGKVPKKIVVYEDKIKDKELFIKNLLIPKNSYLENNEKERIKIFKS